MRVVFEIGVHMLAKLLYDGGALAVSEANAAAVGNPQLAFAAALVLAFALIPAAFLAGILYVAVRNAGGWAALSERLLGPRRRGRR